MADLKISQLSGLILDTGATQCKITHCTGPVDRGFQWKQT